MTDPESRRIPLRIRLPFASAQEFITRYAAHVAPGGIFIATRAVKPQGTLLSFDVVLSDGSRLMRGEGVVERSTHTDTPGQSGMLVRFTRVDAETKALLDRITELREPQPEPPGCVLGIDLGLETCRAAFALEGQSPRPLFAAGGITATVALVPDSTTVIGGAAAEVLRRSHPHRVVYGLSRVARGALGPTPDALSLGDQSVALAELFAAQLKALRSAASTELGHHVTRAAIAVPGTFDARQRRQVAEAATLAGLDLLCIVNSPSAVALAFARGRGLARRRALVFNLGAGSLEVAVVELTGDDVEVISADGDAWLGGVDFDQRLFDALLAQLPEAQREVSLIAPEPLLRSLREAKHALTHQERATLTLDDGSPLELERTRLEEATQPLVERALALTNRVLEAAGLKPQQLDELLVVGGQSQAPGLRHRLQHLTQKRPREDIDVAGAVAMGATLAAQATLQRAAGKRGARLSEVLAVPLEVATVPNGRTRLLERNTRLPAEKSFRVALTQGQAVVALIQSAEPPPRESDVLGVARLQSERMTEANLDVRVAADGRLSVAAHGPSGLKPPQLQWDSSCTPEERAALLAYTPPPQPDPTKRSVLGGLKRFLGR